MPGSRGVVGLHLAISREAIRIMVERLARVCRVYALDIFDFIAGFEMLHFFFACHRVSSIGYRVTGYRAASPCGGAGRYSLSARQLYSQAARVVFDDGINGVGLKDEKVFAQVDDDRAVGYLVAVFGFEGFKVKHCQLHVVVCLRLFGAVR